VTSSNRTPPHDSTAEKAILGALLIKEDLLAVVGHRLMPEYFYESRHRLAYTAMLELAATGVEIDPVTVGSSIQAANPRFTEEFQGGKYFGDMIDACCAPANVDRYVEIVTNLAACRAMIEVSCAITAEGFELSKPPAEYLASAQSLVAEVSERFAPVAPPRTLTQDIQQLLAELERNELPKGVVPTGIASVDRQSGGLWPGLLTVLAARPSMGKSMTALNIAANAAMAGRKVMLISLEDTRQFVAMRMVSRLADIDLLNLVLRRVPKDAFRRVIDAGNIVSPLPLAVEEVRGLTSMQILQMAAAHKNRNGLDLLVIDHLGHVRDEGESDTARVSHAVCGLSDAAARLNVPVLLCHQLNREVEKRSEKRPQLSDLRQSGEIEQEARFVWFLYRPAYYSGSENSEDDPRMEMIVAKANHGKCGTIRLWCRCSRMFVRSWDEETDGSWPSDEGEGKGKEGFKW